MSATQIVDLIINRLNEEHGRLMNDFHKTHNPTVARHCVVDNLLPEDIALKIYHAFPATDQMRQMKNFRERKYTFKQLEQTPAILRDITFAIQNPKVIEVVEKITQIAQQIPDASLYAGGISTMLQGDYLNPHLDNSHDAKLMHYRTLNLLYYVTPDWQADYGGNLELWDTRVKHAVTIPSLFNRLVLMETNRRSWHSVSPVQHEGARCCVSNYYFSKTSPENQPYFNVTSFSARPEQKLRRALAVCDNWMRMTIRKIIPGGLAKKDLYQA